MSATIIPLRQRGQEHELVPGYWLDESDLIRFEKEFPMSIASLVAGAPLRAGSNNRDAVLAVQNALYAAGYRIGVDGDFGPRTKAVVQQFQKQHGLTLTDGIVGAETAALLDHAAPALIAAAAPLVHASGLPHDDTASLIAFYGDPDAPDFAARNLVDVPTPFLLTYEGKPWPHAIKFHRRCAGRFADAFARIWQAAGRNPMSPVLKRISRFSGSYNNRSVRGSTRKSCHAFGAALDVDAEDLPMSTHGVDPEIMPIEVVNAFDAAGLFWGNRYTGRKDPMHWQAAHE